ncbi:Interferon-induced guanylate-binding protein [Entamoeba marina]
MSNSHDVYQPYTLITPSKDHSKVVFNEDICQKIIDHQQQNWNVISIIGPYHSGKSFLLNALINQTNIFPVAQTNNPTTKGIDVYLSNNGVMYLDTEGLSSGLANSTEEYDALIFSIAALSSDLMIYNTIRTIDQQQLDYLELLARRTQLFALKAELEKEGDVVRNFIKFPELFWVVRDYAFDESTKNWLSSLLSANQRKAFGIAINKPNDDSTKIQQLFDKMTAHTTFLPHSNKDQLKHLSINCLEKQFLNDLQSIRNSIEKSLPEHKINSRQFCSLIRFYVHAANSNLFPVVPTVWDGYVTSLKQSVKDSVIQHTTKKAYNEIHKEKPLSIDEWVLVSSQIQQESQQIAQKMLFGLKDLTSYVLNQIESEVSTVLETSSIENSQRISEYIKQTSHDIEKELTTTLNINFPTSKYEITKVVDELKRRFISILKSRIIKYEKSFTETTLIPPSFSDLINENIGEVQKQTNIFSSRAISQFPVIIDLKPEVLLLNELGSDLQNVMSFFDENVKYFDDWEIVDLMRNNITSTLSLKKHQLIRENEKKIKQLLRSSIAQILIKFEQNVAGIVFPIFDDDLKRTLSVVEKECLNEFTQLNVQFKNDTTFALIYDELKQEIREKEQKIYKLNSDAFIRISLHDFERIRKEIRLEDKTYFLVWSYRSYLFNKFDKALQTQITDKVTRAKIIDNYIHDEYSNQISSVNKLSIFVIITTCIAIILPIVFLLKKIICVTHLSGRYTVLL